ncbi:MAG TPA: hypothetical protein VFX92_02415 [Candidatus Krumholzibacteria bacterium]|nr:hypothetical protein [Candidatus Krumholzibacteria bacterium]
MRALLLSLALVLVGTGFAPSRVDGGELPYSAWGFDFSLTLPGTPDEIFGAITGDISGWWDHSFSGKPARLFIEPKVGGGFYEYFDDKGNGVRHATVTYVDRPKALRMEGPLGLAGNAFVGVYTYTFEALGADSTTLKLDVQAAGHLEPGWDAVVERVWRHFLIEQFQPYIESGAYRSKQ